MDVTIIARRFLVIGSNSYAPNDQIPVDVIGMDEAEKMEQTGHVQILRAKPASKKKAAKDEAPAEPKLNAEELKAIEEAKAAVTAAAKIDDEVKAATESNEGKQQVAYLSVANLKLYLGITDTSEDTLLGQIIDRAEAYINQQTRRIFDASEDSTRYFHAVHDVYDNGLLLLLDEDLLTITTLTNGDATVITSDKYVLLPTNESPKYGIRLKLSAGIAWEYTDDPEEAISIEGLWGFSQTPPNDIIHASVRLSSYIYRQKNNAGEFDRTILAGNSTLLPTQIPRDIEELLRPYTKILH